MTSNTNNDPRAAGQDDLLDRDADLGFYRAMEQAAIAAARLGPHQAALMYDRIAQQAAVHRDRARAMRETRPANQAEVEHRAA